MAEDMADDQVLNAAVTIRGELDHLVPGDAQALGAELDKRIERASATDQEQRSAALDEVIEMLTRRKPTQRRLYELIPAADTDRLASADVWAPDLQLAGETVEDDGDEILSLECVTCGYVNKLKFHPPADDPPDCQNPDPPPHPLKLG